MYPQHYTGKFLNLDLETWGASYTVKKVVRRSMKEIALDLVEPNNAQVTLTFESQDGKQFTGLYRRRGSDDAKQVHMTAAQSADEEELVLMITRPEPDGPIPIGVVSLLRTDREL